MILIFEVIYRTNKKLKQESNKDYKLVIAIIMNQSNYQYQFQSIKSKKTERNTVQRTIKEKNPK